jgi:hypothetical protein
VAIEMVPETVIGPPVKPAPVLIEVTEPALKEFEVAAVIRP